MRRNLGLGTLSLVAALTAAVPAVAQTYTFERSFAPGVAAERLVELLGSISAGRARPRAAPV